MFTKDVVPIQDIFVHNSADVPNQSVYMTYLRSYSVFDREVHFGQLK